MNILIYTITRNSETKLYKYYEQISVIPKLFPEHNFYLSIYENDSVDDTKSLLRSFDFSNFKDVHIKTEDLGVPSFGSVQDEQRVKILADARNKAIFDCGFLDLCDKVMMIESDAIYQSRAVRSLINFEKNNNIKADIVSSMYFWHVLNPVLYDTWATRWDENCRENTLRFDWKEKDYDKYYSTCNGICLFDAEPFKKGAKYHWFNERFGCFDCDTVVICENFHKMGYSDIFIDYKSRVYTSE